MPTDLVYTVHAPHGIEATFRTLRGEERFGEPFRYIVEVQIEASGVVPSAADLIGYPIGVEIYKDDSYKRCFHGLISRFIHTGTNGGYRKYEIEFRPHLWFLSHTQNSVIYQNQTVKQIIEKVLKTKNGISAIRFNLNGTYSAFEYCVQYRESDLDFINRLCEEEGIYYYITHEASSHTIVFTDDGSTHPAMNGESILFRDASIVGSEDQVYSWDRMYSIQANAFVLRDYDYNKPRANLQVNLSGNRTHALSSFEKYDYPGAYSETADGRRYVKFQNEQAQVEHLQIHGIARTHRISTGMTFELQEHETSSENAKYTVIGTEIEVTSGEVDRFTSGSENKFNVKFVAIPNTSTFRLPRRTPSPIIAGPQTAVVVGKSGEEIWTDSLGRIKVQFPWDRVGTNDENSSCWIRVSQTWAGKTWGAMHIPRIGQEVIVEFLEGDPNRPIVTGRVYNADQTVPYQLPDNATQSGLKSRSTPNGDGATFNELRFEDKKGEEEIYFHAEKNFTRIVENNDSLKVGFEKKDAGNQTIDVYKDQVVNIGTDESQGSQTLVVWKDQTQTIKTGNRTTEVSKGNNTLTVSEGNRVATIQKGNDTLTISEGGHTVTVSKGNQTIQVGEGDQTIDITQGTCNITAGTKIILTVGGSSITIESSKITLKSSQIILDADMKVELTASTTNVSGSSNVKIQGGMVEIN